MPIDDALDKIKDVKKEKKKKRSLLQEAESPEIYKVLNGYPSAIARIRIGIYTFEEEEVEELAEYIRFKPGLETVIEIPKDEFLDRIGQEDSALQSILLETDLGETIPDPLHIGDYKSYSGIPNFLDLKDISGHLAFKNFELITQSHFIIPNLEFFSLFIEEGAKLREYARTIHKDEEDIFYWKKSGYIEMNDFKPFSAKSLKSFYDQTGTKEIRAMIEQVNELHTLLSRRCVNNGINDAKKILFDRLKKYNPGLVYNREENY